MCARVQFQKKRRTVSDANLCRPEPPRAPRLRVTKCFINFPRRRVQTRTKLRVRNATPICRSNAVGATRVKSPLLHLNCVSRLCRRVRAEWPEISFGVKRTKIVRAVVRVARSNHNTCIVLNGAIMQLINVVPALWSFRTATVTSAAGIAYGASVTLFAAPIPAARPVAQLHKKL